MVSKPQGVSRTVAFTIWIVINTVFLSILGYHHKDYIDHEYVVKGRGGNARVITRADDPEYYESRMKYFWLGYILCPLLSGAVLHLRRREIEKKRAPNDAI